MAPVRRRPHVRGGRGRAKASDAAEQPEAAARGEAAGAPASEEDLLEAIASLYDDQLKPYGRIIRKRLAERRKQRAAAAEAGVLPGIAADEAMRAVASAGDDLRQQCQACRRLRVEDEPGGEFSALFVDRDGDFVDIYSQEDTYSPAFWKEFSDYFDQQAADALTKNQPNLGALPGGRYASAAGLALRRLPFLKGLSLGKLCHVVQLAIAKKRLLGYLNGNVVPYCLSTSMEKSERAKNLSATSSAREQTVADWDEAVRIVRELMKRKREPIPLSNVKRLFRSDYQKVLSETALGHSNMAKLLDDRHFRDVCKVQLVTAGYMVFPVELDEVATPTSIFTESDTSSPGGGTSRSKKPAPPEIEVRHTFYHIPVPPASPIGSTATRRTSSVPTSVRLAHDERQMPTPCQTPQHWLEPAYISSPDAQELDIAQFGGHAAPGLALACCDGLGCGVPVMQLQPECVAVAPAPPKGIRKGGRTLTLEPCEDPIELPSCFGYPLQTPSPVSVWSSLSRCFPSEARQETKASGHAIPDILNMSVNGASFMAVRSLNEHRSHP